MIRALYHPEINKHCSMALLLPLMFHGVSLTVCFHSVKCIRCEQSPTNMGHILNDVWRDIQGGCWCSPGCSRSRWTATLRSRLSRSFSSLDRRSSLWYSATVSLTARKISSAAAVSLSFRNAFSSSSLVMFPASVSRGGTSFCLHPLTRTQKPETHRLRDSADVWRHLLDRRPHSTAFKGRILITSHFHSLLHHVKVHLL